MNLLFRQGSCAWRLDVDCACRFRGTRSKPGGFMAYPEDLEGKYIDYRVDPGGAVPGLVGTIKDDATTGARVAVYRSKIAGVPRPDQFENTNMPWTFTFLKYFAGVVTTAGLQTAILTGPMSGCYLFTYTKDGQRKLAHVGTGDTPGCEETINVKKAWRKLLAGITGEAMGVSPLDYFTPAEFRAAMFPGGRLPQVVGSFETRPYAMLLAPVPAAMAPPAVSLLKVAKIKPMTLKPWTTIQNSPKFREAGPVR